jgi:GDP-D-mannose dehydratase
MRPLDCFLWGRTKSLVYAVKSNGRAVDNTSRAELLLSCAQIKYNHESEKRAITSITRGINCALTVRVAILTQACNMRNLKSNLD